MKPLETVRVSVRRHLIRALLGRERFDDVRELQRGLRIHPRIATAFARSAATSALREIDPTDPSTWEFTGFSQNGEDGIIDYLCRRLIDPNRYFIEIGASDGFENNTSWLALGCRYGGLLIDADPRKVAMCRHVFSRLNSALDFAAVRVNRRTVDIVIELALMPEPDVFSLDIDGIDYHVALELLSRGLRPKICVVEYNSAFGPALSVTVEYRDDFNWHREHPSGLYYGASVTAWRRLFAGRGYRFLTVETNGANAFFVDPAAFEPAFLDRVCGCPYRENIVTRRQARCGWTEQFERIRHLPLVEIPETVIARPAPALSAPAPLVVEADAGRAAVGVMSHEATQPFETELRYR